MNRIVKALSAHDVAYQEMAQILFGDGADELISKISPDQADVASHQARKQKRQAQVGLASNVLGISAGTAGLAAAAKDERLKGGGKFAHGIHRVGSSLERGARKTSAGQKYYKKIAKPRTAAALATGAVGLQAANIGGDVVANRVLSREAKKKPVGKSSDYSTPNKGKLVRIAAKKGQPKLKELGHDLESKARGKAGQNPVNAKNESSGKVHKRIDLDDFSGDLWFEGEISKMDTDHRQVFGWASVVEKDGQPVHDLQGDIISADEIEKAAYTYVQKSRKGGDNHRRNGEEPYHASDMIESMMFTPEKVEKMGLAPGSVPTGWWVGFQVNDDDLWGEVKKGRRTNFSIHGRGKRT